MTILEQRMQRFSKAGLYFVTSQSLSCGRCTLEVVLEAIAGGVKLVQIREKKMSKDELMELCLEARSVTEAAEVLLIVNDHIDIALAVNADGVHLGLEDLPIERAREMAPELIIGASSHSVAEAKAAEAAGASYVNIGPLFPTDTKDWKDAYLGIEGLKEISSSISIPFTVMGGIKKKHIPELLDAGAKTIALVTAVTAADNPESQVRELIDAIRS